MDTATFGTGAPLPIRYHLLGRVEVVVDGTTTPVAGMAQRQLLAFLLLRRGRLVPTASLVNLLWEDRAPADLAGALRSQVARLRRALGPHRGDLVSCDGGYAMVLDASATDTGRFTDLVARARAAPPTHILPLLEEALALWQGPALADLAHLASFHGEAVRLEELRFEAEERRADHLLGSGREGQAVAALLPVVDAAPDRERARGLLMEGLYRTGRHAEALRVYDAWRRQLAEERGLEPSPALRELHVEILSHRVASRPVSSPAGRDSGAPVPPPASRSTFVGRDGELVAAAEALMGSRLVTLTGPGGVGKTRLAAEVARRLGECYPDGVIWCDLSVVADPAEVAIAVAIAAGLRRWTPVPIEDQLARRLSGRRCLLVVDNCEHVAEGAAAVVGTLTVTLAELAVLATSRERLVLDGEHVVVVGPLPVAGQRSPAALLLADRARSAGSDEPILEAPPDLLMGVCQKLDGLPLALELAAARLRSMSLAELAAALDHRFELLDLGPRSPVRHRSLRAVVDWSYDQLAPAQRRAFDRLCVFTGSFTLGDATTLLHAGGALAAEVPHLVADLVERSLLIRSGQRTQSHYSMLETLRVYGLERLAERGEEAGAREQHAAWALWLAGEAARGLAGPDERSWVQQLDDHLDELRTAHHWLVVHDPQGALRLADRLHHYAFWRTRSEVFSWMAAAVDAAAPSPLARRVSASVCAGKWQRGELAAAATALAAARAGGDCETEPCDSRVVEQMAELELLAGRTDSAARLFTRSAERAREEGDHLQVVCNLGSAALALAYAGQQTEAEARASTAVELADRTGNPTARAFARFATGEVLSARSAAGAAPLLRAAIELAESVDNSFVAGMARVTLATVVASLDPVAALREHERAIMTWQRSGCWTAQWVTLRNLAELLARVDQPEDAAVLRAAAAGTRAGAPPFGRDEEHLEALGQHLAATLGPAQLAVITRRSAQLDDDQLVALALDAIRRVLAAAGGA